MSYDSRFDKRNGIFSEKVRRLSKRDCLERRVGCSDSNEQDYDHEAVVSKLVGASYCTRDYIEAIEAKLPDAIEATASREELIALGHRIKEVKPRVASDIFIYTGDEEGRKEMRQILFHSIEPYLQSYTFFMASDEGPESLREYGEILRENDSNPVLVRRINEKLADLRLKKARFSRRTSHKPVTY